MRIACPSCDAAYDVPPDRVTPGRSVRCARCATAWTPVLAQSPPSPDPQRPPDPVPAVSPAPEIVPPVIPNDEPALVAEAPDPAPAAPDPRSVGPAPASRPAGRLPLLGAWLLSLALLAGLGWAAVTYRDTVIRAWPPSERAYLALGLRQGAVAPPPAH